MSDQEKTKSPGDFIRDELEARGWTQADLARVLDRPLPTVNRILNGKHAVLPEMAIALSMAFGNEAQEWMARESAYRLSLADSGAEEVKKRARLYEVAPVKDMEKRQWIRTTKDSKSLEKELKHFFSVETLDKEPKIVAAMRRSNPNASDISASQRAWCFRVRQLGSSLLAGRYDESKMDNCSAALRKIAAYPQEVHKVPQTLARFGIRFAIVEPLPGCKADGVALWHDDAPIIGMSVRYDRIDNFWFTLFHELSHIIHRDKPHLDVHEQSAEQFLELKSDIELRADNDAAQSLIPKKELDSFVLRVGPRYSKDRIIRFAHRIKMHPGVIVGQLQKRGEIGWNANREMLSKIRHIVLPASTVDGWGHTIDPRSLQ